MRAAMKAVSVAMIACCTAAGAAELRAVSMTKSGDLYSARAETWLDATPEFVFAVLLDYDEFHRLSRGLAETRWLEESSEGRPLAYTRVDSCVAFFCRSLEKTEIVIVTGDLSFETRALADRSDFRLYEAKWSLARDEGGTRILFDVRMQTDFWVPPLIGPWAIRRKAESSALEIAQRIEYLAANKLTLQQFDLKRFAGEKKQ